MLRFVIALTALSLAVPAPAAGHRSPRRTVASFIASYNSHDLSAEARCFASTGVAFHNGNASPMDAGFWEAERGYRRFDAVTRARFRYHVKSASGDSVEIALREDNDFLRAIGVEVLHSRWRYVVREGLIEEEHHLSRPEPAFIAALHRFRDWLRSERPAGSRELLDQDGDLVFNGDTARGLLSLALRWQALGRPEGQV